MTGDEHQAEKIVANVIVESALEIGHGHLFDLKLAAKFLVLAFEELAASQPVDGSMLGGGHEPGARVVRDA